MRCELSVEIPAPPAVVWAIAQDPQRRPLWDYRISRYAIEGPPDVGATVSITANLGLLRPQVAGVMLRWDPPHQSVLQTHWTSSPLLPKGAGSWTFTPTLTGTRLTARFTLDDSDLPWWIARGPYLAMVKWDTRRSFQRLRRLVMAT